MLIVGIKSDVISIDVDTRKIGLRCMHIVAQHLIGQHLANHGRVSISITQLDTAMALIILLNKLIE